MGIKNLEKAQELGQRLKAYREAADITLKGAAAHMQFRSPQTIGNWERGIQLPSEEKLKKLSAFYDLTPAQTQELLDLREAATNGSNLTAVANPAQTYDSFSTLVAKSGGLRKEMPTVLLFNYHSIGDTQTNQAILRAAQDGVRVTFVVASSRDVQAIRTALSVASIGMREDELNLAPAHISAVQPKHDPIGIASGIQAPLLGLNGRNICPEDRIKREFPFLNDEAVSAAKALLLAERSLAADLSDAFEYAVFLGPQDQEGASASLYKGVKGAFFRCASNAPWLVYPDTKRVEALHAKISKGLGPDMSDPYQQVPVLPG